MNSIQNHATLLRRSLKGNALFSFASGLVILLGHKGIASFLQLPHSGILLLVGIGLIGFAIGLHRNAVRKNISALEARIAVILDLAWVAGSALILSLGVLSTGGNWILVLIADIVFLFAVLQHLGLRRMRQGLQESAR